MALSRLGAYFASTAPEMLTCTPVSEFGIDDPRRSRPVLLFGLVGIVDHQPHIIGVADGKVAFARIDRLGLLPVGAGRLAREIVAHCGEPGPGLVEPPMIDARGDQPDIVDMLARARAQAPLPFRIGQILVADMGFAHPVDRGVKHPRAHRERRPLPVRIAIGFGHARKHLLGDRLGHLQRLGVGQVPHIDGDDQVGR